MQSRVRGAAIAWSSFVIGIALTILVGLGDWNATARQWLTSHPYTKEAVTGLVGLVVTVWLIASWLGWRESRRLHKVVVIAYRSLAQSVNDSGRRLLGPINGADLWALGIPDTTADEVTAVRAWLRHRGLPVIAESAGQWPERTNQLNTTLTAALEDDAKVTELFRATSSARRGMQAATAQWAPTLLAVRGQTASILADVQEFTDLLELLQEALRGLTSVPVDDSSARAMQRENVENLYWYTIHVYERERDLLKALGRLPSDNADDRARYIDAARRWSEERAGDGREAQPEM